jgi:hypothetical protein
MKSLAALLVATFVLVNAVPADAGPIVLNCILVPDAYEASVPAVPVRKDTSEHRDGYLVWGPVAHNGQPTGQWRFTGSCSSASHLAYCAWTFLCVQTPDDIYDPQRVPYHAMKTFDQLSENGVQALTPQQLIQAHYDGPRAPSCSQVQAPPCEPQS